MAVSSTTSTTHDCIGGISGGEERQVNKYRARRNTLKCYSYTRIPTVVLLVIQIHPFCRHIEIASRTLLFCCPSHYVILALFFLSLSRSLDVPYIRGHLSRLFSPPPPLHYDTCLFLYLEIASALSSLVDSHRVAPSHAATAVGALSG